ncbi:MAG: Wadjet anti-phage system protein JetD domain-containing protein [Rhodanobacter sp.]
MSVAKAVLERLLRRGESARLRGADERASLSMTGTKEYTALRSLAELELFHAEVALAEHDGAIAVHREYRSGDGSRLLRLSVLDLAVLARHLGVKLLDDRVTEAAHQLDAWTTRFPVVVEVLDSWRHGHKVRGFGAEAAEDLARAAIAVAARTDDASHERILRRESVRLFGDSKRLENLTAWLDLLVTGELVASGLSKEEIWSAIGLRREPQPMLLAGVGSVELVELCLPLVRPYLGLPVESVRAVTTSARCMLSIENLASFHDAARAPGAEAVLLLYTGGMPSPAWRAAYASILSRAPSAWPIYHWGDIDEGGFRIAAAVADVARGVGHALQPWMMSPLDLPRAIMQRAALPSKPQLAAMTRWADRAGWSGIASDLSGRPLLLEQESLDPTFPP